LKFPAITFAIFLTMSLSLLGSRSFAPVFSSQFLENKSQLDPIWQNGQYEKGLTAFRIAAENAKKAGFAKDQLWFLHNLGACQFGMFQFQSALNTMNEERQLARRIDDRRILAALGSNMSALYEQMKNLPEAEIAAEDGLKYAELLDPGRRALLYSQLGTIQGKREHLALAEQSFQKAIEVAHKAKNENAHAQALDALAYARMEAGKLPEAEAAARESLEIRKNPEVGGTDQTYMVLGTVLAKRGDLKAGIAMLDDAEKALSLPHSLTPHWWVYMRRGQIKIQAEDWPGALKDLRLGLESAREWRADVPANDANRTSSEEELADLYQFRVEAGNRLYFVTHVESLIRETFEAAEENRASSLRALLPQESDWRRRLPPHYYELLAKLQAAHAAQMYAGNSQASAALQQLRSEMQQIEASAGAAASNRRNGAMDQAQKMLNDRSVLFSFQLGEKGSWMWAVTKDGISLHALPPQVELKNKVAAFQRELGSFGKTPPASGGELYRDLFGSVAPEILARERWLLVLDGTLFDLPFPALTTAEGKFLIEDHSLQIAPGALMLKSGGFGAASQGGFLAVGDPIYNRADPRAREYTQWKWPSLLTRASYRQSPSFARLWGTAKEIEVSARTWNAPATTILTGREVSPENFWDKTLTKPDIIHIATHILEENEKPQTGWIAFSQGKDGQIQYVTPEDILANSITARLVVLSGCSSGKAEVHPATGLMGLTRAWIAAGAGAVLATRWPTVDDDGAFFESFYRNLRQSEPIDPSEALRQSSLEMLKSGTWRANPSFWAGYFLIGKY